MAAFAEYESDVKADYAKANYRHALQQGRTWGMPPLGYRAKDKRYYVVEEEAEIVRTMYRRYQEGASLTRIAIELNAAGHTGHRKGYWKTKQVGRALDNPAYVGLTVLHEDVFEAQWQPIVPRDMWEEVHRLRLPQNRGQRKRKQGTGGPYLLSGLIVCGKCGSKAHHHRKSDGHSMYECMIQRHTQKCDGGGVSRERADRIVTQEVLRRVRFSLDEGAEFVSASDAWVTRRWNKGDGRSPQSSSAWSSCRGSLAKCAAVHGGCGSNGSHSSPARSSWPHPSRRFLPPSAEIFVKVDPSPIGLRARSA